MEELSPYFQGLKVEPYFEREKDQRGRPKVAGYIFSFKAEQKKEKKKVVQPTQESIAKVTSWKKTNRYCPKCKRPNILSEAIVNGVISVKLIRASGDIGLFNLLCGL